MKIPYEESEIYGEKENKKEHHIDLDWENIQQELMAKVDKEKKKKEEIFEQEREKQSKNIIKYS